MAEPRRPDLAIFAATSGHSGVDRIVANLLPEFARAGVRVDLLHVHGHGPYIDDLPDRVRQIELGSHHVSTSLLPLVRYLRRHQPRVLFSDKDRANRTALRAARWSRASTRVFVRLGTTVSVNLEAKRPLEAWIQRRSIRRYGSAAGVIVPSEGAARDLAHVGGFARESIQVLPNPIVGPGLDRLAESPVPHPWLGDPDIPVILGVGSLTPRKDYALLLRAFAQLVRHRDARLIVLGDGPDRPGLERLARELGIAARMLMPGFCQNPYPWIASASVFAHASRWEGLGIVLVEALALGTPVVATDCPSGPAEVLDHGRLGRLVPVGDAHAMADALTRTLDQPVDCDALRAGATGFRIDHSAQAYLDALGLAGGDH